MRSVFLLVLAPASLSTALVAKSLEFTSPVVANPSLPPTASKTADPRYACGIGSDCAIVDHGDCCGYYPVCAHANAVFTSREKCPSPDRVGICGYPSIDFCDCRGGICVGVKDDYVVASPLE
ncbi:hypothetical protein AOQ84DRAFT_160972 [Glonium stellatum]|uniref:Uncharacterized protein n=1 Tax=Glonium stellatum TaxID=574774 RepID=A0A8E2F7X5_9PEZI|nr:hypothetical protein AOQ84DRAFT_160972 [Glonium stellatum]